MRPSETLWTSGQISADQLRALKAAGFSHIINLRPETEDAGYDEPAVAKELGLSFQRLPVSGPADLTRENVVAFNQLLSKVGNGKTLVHCASGNRVGALFALRAAWLQGKSVEEALAVGRAHGLTKMEGIVSGLLK